MEIILTPIGFVSNQRKNPVDDFWGDILSDIVLNNNVPEEATAGLDSFSHLDIIYYFDKVEPDKIVYSGRPRGNPDYPKIGIFAQRKKDRPNQIGICSVELVQCVGRTITVKYLDAIDGTPVLDIKPVFREFSPKGDIKQPAWVSNLMEDYWKVALNQESGAKN